MIRNTPLRTQPNQGLQQIQVSKVTAIVFGTMTKSSNLRGVEDRPRRKICISGLVAVRASGVPALPAARCTLPDRAILCKPICAARGSWPGTGGGCSFGRGRCRSKNFYFLVKSRATSIDDSFEACASVGGCAVRRRRANTCPSLGRPSRPCPIPVRMGGDAAGKVEEP